MLKRIPHGRFALAGLFLGVALTLAGILVLSELGRNALLIEQQDQTLKARQQENERLQNDVQQQQRDNEQLRRDLQAKLEAKERSRLATLLAPAARAAGSAPVYRTASADGDYWARLRACESGGNYATNTGNGYTGAYQYDAATWNGYGGYSQAYQAPPAVQDQKAQEDYARRGSSPWPTCG